MDNPVRFGGWRICKTDGSLVAWQPGSANPHVLTSVRPVTAVLALAAKILGYRDLQVNEWFFEVNPGGVGTWMVERKNEQFLIPLNLPGVASPLEVKADTGRFDWKHLFLALDLAMTLGFSIRKPRFSLLGKGDVLEWTWDGVRHEVSVPKLSAERTGLESRLRAWVAASVEQMPGFSVEALTRMDFLERTKVLCCPGIALECFELDSGGTSRVGNDSAFLPCMPSLGPDDPDWFTANDLAHFLGDVLLADIDRGIVSPDQH